MNGICFINAGRQKNCMLFNKINFRRCVKFFRLVCVYVLVLSRALIYVKSNEQVECAGASI